MHRLRCLAALLCGPLWSAPLLAAEEDPALLAIYGDRSTVSIATGAPQPLRRAPSVATVITAADIAAMGATDLDQVLRAVPGMHVLLLPYFGRPVYTVRGVFSTTNPHVQMQINGVPITSIFTGDRGDIWVGIQWRTSRESR
jgi:iron complex outermembrane receptor protein